MASVLDTPAGMGCHRGRYRRAGAPMSDDWQQLRDAVTDINVAVKHLLEMKHMLEVVIRSEVPTDLDIALPKQVADLIGSTPAGLAQMRFRGTGPKFIKVGKKVVYRWSDVRAYLDANTVQRTPRDSKEGSSA